MNTVPELIRAFESGTLPRKDWTHQAHLLVALWYLRTLPRAEATERIRNGILKLNAALGIITTRDYGYHETITRFYIHMVGRFAEATKHESDWETLQAELMRECGHKELPYQYYTKERLNSWEARSGWMEPDVKALP
jgi:hypothetical protein